MDNALRTMVVDAVATGDAKKLYSAMEIALANDLRREIAETARRAAAVETFQAAAPAVGGRYKVITMAGRVGRKPATMIVTGVSYKDGGGYRVSKVSYHTDRARAMRFSTTAAQGVAEYLIRCGYQGVRLEGID